MEREIDDEELIFTLRLVFLNAVIGDLMSLLPPEEKRELTSLWRMSDYGILAEEKCFEIMEGEEQ